MEPSTGYLTQPLLFSLDVHRLSSYTKDMNHSPAVLHHKIDEETETDMLHQPYKDTFYSRLHTVHATYA